MATKAEVTLTFQVTFKAPSGMNIPTVRQHIKDALMGQRELGIISQEDVKVHLTNKETHYGKR